MRPLDLYEKDPSKKVTIYFEGKPLEAYEGEKLPVALLANGVFWITTSLQGRKRGAFTFGPLPVVVNGVKNIDGRKTLVKDGMRIERQNYGEFQEAVEIDGSKEVLREVVDVAIIGGGIAGIGAALELQEHLTVALIEEKGWLGGLVFVEGTPQEGFEGEPKKVIKELTSKFNENVKVFKGTMNLGVFDEGEYFLVPAVKKDQLIEIMAKRVILATGAVENILLFENNEFPGVFRLDFALEVMNKWGVAPGKKVAVVGRKPERIIPELEKWGIEYIVVPNPKRVEGEEKVERLIDMNGNVYEVDAVIVSDYSLPDINPITQAGGKLKFKHGYYVPVLDEQNRIRDGIYVAGSSTGIKSHYANYLEGKLVATYILREFGYEATPAIYKEKLGEFEPEAMPIQRIEFKDMNLEDVQICGCDVNLRKVDDVVKKGITDLQIVKRLTHLAMGFCQGRFCLFNGALLVSQRTGIDMGKIDLPVARPPLKNVRVKALSKGE
ncbi:MAG TPA: FAD-dependent oxidoreductase [Thermococcaceae archaeon]|uniref:Sarcosine oxidase, alpha subunit n=2 Tax=Thermococcus sibiricus TaxID=172049 RepID=C6A255_THESM|nr:FAD-dependent oxidoreductase [Thermococcus sibiricus]ACS89700.1 Sarcosine oxidase, alpha subunit [Thermococcus sibiricus MM 739]KUK17906.1 MAG: Sarcosine oxidase, alpha subunit [Thermococcus sibiricus]KUK28815.1 MAG: Sarcosine oxidase, alpha subunit [Thermococcus sp. 40_45]HII67579.1 FAD-dependent oxidoreductase [Thermococcaceae archaeon]